MREIRILGICGSLRAVSSHRSLLSVVAGLLPAGVTFEISDAIGNLPLFNPDLADAAPESVLRFRAEIAAADAVLIASPEYAHGITGFDALHLAAAEAAGCDYLVTTDDGLLKKSKRHSSQLTVSVLNPIDIVSLP